MKSRIVSLLTLTATAFMLSAQSAFATVAVPTYPSCVNPQGTLSVSYDSGLHGIAGRSDRYTGSDKVYQLSGNNQVMQCLCLDNGNGVQTNWLKANTLSDADIKVMENEGWTYVAEGSLWGLDSGAYLAKNSDYSCNAATNNTTSNVVVPTTAPATTVSAPVQAVLNLASTGNIAFLYGLIAAGSTSLLAGLILKFTSKRS